MSEPQNPADYRRLIESLTPRQQDVLSQVYMNNDLGHHPKTVKALLAKGLIVAEKQNLGGHPPLFVERYDFPNFAAHIAWCEWCEAQPEVAT